jgi:RNA:NAD 2'-phosphotransferase (TPT1/KptA family)
MKQGLAPKIPDILLDVTSLHVEVSQVGKGGRLRGREIKRWLGAAVLETKQKDRFTVESAWKKLRT